ncbi:N-acetylmuramoyl-L-alanine amidase [Halobacillus kuroshimensis]|uniref:N-acetylmuramoyl-L-alanine amidase n=1 Tax=Halobacillus kuroshimensis TaxID=302481 RepID=A0ABS3DTY0_9BACI|nr:N-acetylmuramoyl-L-alanine amidase [Halobacillus kuroshimensis]MBN8234798.1 N-acetylmuramoyl-L-alanine amidase [Halobacillus kuroshimensis]
MKTIVIDPGHGGTDPGAVYRGYQEKTFNLSIALNVQRYLTEHYEAEIVMTRTSDITVSLSRRTAAANAIDADFFLSIHNNAAGGSGFESYIYNGALAPNTQAYQSIIHNTIYQTASKYRVNNRGMKQANLFVTRETHMSSLLLELLFVDHPDDLALLRNSTFINDISRAIAEGTAKALQLPKLSSAASPVSSTLYKVMAGSFQSRENAEQRTEFLSQNGVASFIVPASVSGGVYYRVQTGAFSKETNAKSQVEQLKRIGIADTYILAGTDKSESPVREDDLYRVIAGSFRERKNAEERVNLLTAAGFPSFITTLDIGGLTYYRVQAGAFQEMDHAKALVQKLKSFGIIDAFIWSGSDLPPLPDSPAPETPEDKWTILGQSVIDGCQLDQFVRSVYPDAPQLGRYYRVYGNLYGIRGDIAFAQAVHETNYFRFTGDVQRDQNNFAGIGAVGGGAAGASFSTPEEGVHAQIQHLYAYASSDPIPEGVKLVDPRFDLVARGSARTWTALNGKWAVPGNQYGQLILSIYERMAEYTQKSIEIQQQTLQKLIQDLNQ